MYLKSRKLSLCKDTQYSSWFIILSCQQMCILNMLLYCTSKFLCRQGEYLHEVAKVYENIFGINQWWIGLTDLGNLTYKF
jgi:hypothetical protein